jgi:hypothetical protein
VPDKTEKNGALDVTPENRLAKPSNAKELNVALSGLAIVAAIAFDLGGAQLHLPAAIALALLPGVLIFLVHRKPLVYAISKPKSDPRTDLSIAFTACGLGLVLGDGNVHFVDISTVVGYAALVALLCSMGVLSSIPQNSPLLGVMVGTLCIAGAYGWGLAAAVDSVPDKSAPASYTTTVRDKHEVHGRGTSYYLYLAPWGPIEGINHVRVSRSMYEGAFIGELVCLELRPGILHAEWYQLVACTSSRTGRCCRRMG